MHHGVRMRVVKIKPMHQRAIQHHRIAQRQAHGIANHGMGTGAGQALQRIGCAMGEIKTGGGKRDAKAIQHMALGLFDHIGGDIFRAKLRGKTGQLTGNWGLALHINISHGTGQRIHHCGSSIRFYGISAWLGGAVKLWPWRQGAAVKL